MYADKQQYNPAGMGQNMGQVGTWGPTEQKVGREVEIPAQFSRLGSSIDVATDSLRELIGRLEPLLRPNATEPVGTAVSQTAIGPGTQMGAELQGFAYRIHELTNRMQDALRRLEV